MAATDGARRALAALLLAASLGCDDGGDDGLVADGAADAGPTADAADPAADAADPAADAAPGFCADEDRDVAYQPGLERMGAGGYVVRLVESVPAPPAKGQNTWTLDVLAPGGAPAVGVGLRLYSAMPDHGHGTSNPEIAPGASPGRFAVSKVNLYMKGFWTNRVTVTDAGSGADLDFVVFPFCVE